MDIGVLIYIAVGFGLILFGVLIHKGKVHQLISGYEIFKWKGADLNVIAKVIFKATLFMGFGIAVISSTLVYFGYELYANRALMLIVLLGTSYIYIAGFRMSKKR